MAELVCFSRGSLFKGVLQQFNIACTNNTGRLMRDKGLREIIKRMVKFEVDTEFGSSSKKCCILRFPQCN